MSAISASAEIHLNESAACLSQGIQPLPVPGLRASAKVAFTTRRVDLDDARYLVTDAKPASGDLALARVTKVVRHTRIQTDSGRRAQLFEGDLIVVAYGARYATDQTEAVIPDDVGPCQLVAAGGIIGAVVRWHDGLRRSTQVTPLGLLAARDGKPLNLAQYRIRPTIARHLKTIVVAGTGMNSGKTTATAHCIRGLKGLGFRVAGIKVTGTGAGNDVWTYEDAGADLALDFTDAGYPSTYQIPLAELESVYHSLAGYAEHQGMDFAVIEIADGLLQRETAGLLSLPSIAERYTGLIVTAADALGAQASVEWLERRGHRVDCVSGSVTASPLACDEAARATRLPIASRQMLADAARLPQLLKCLNPTLPARESSRDPGAALC